MTGVIVMELQSSFLTGQSHSAHEEHGACRYSKIKRTELHLKKPRTDRLTDQLTD